VRSLRVYREALASQWHALVRQSRIVARQHPVLIWRTIIGLPIASIAVVVAIVIWAASGLPDVNALRRIGDMDQATTVFAADGQIAFAIYKEHRIEVPLDQISPRLIDAVLAIEDQRFYQHRGFDLVRIGSAALTNLRHARALQGGSTITQQLARLSFLTPDKTFRRKFQELILAWRLERMFTKNQILELYLNKVYFGGGLYGVEAAAHGYFGKRASEVNVAEAALLAGLVKSPSTYAPTVRMDRAIARRNLVLQVMRDTSVLPTDEWRAAKASQPVLQDDFRSEDPIGLYFKEQVRQELVERFGWERVYQGGLRVFSTIDMRMQQAAESAVAEGLKGLDARRQSKRSRAVAAEVPGENDGHREAQDDPLQAALIAMDPATGYVRAMVGGRDFDKSRFNRAVQAKRQPGSAFKPFVYAAALEAGYTPASLIDNLNAPIATLQGAWTPEDEHSTADSMTLRAALRTSSNRAAVRLLQEVGIPRTVDYAKAMGVGDVPSVPSLALGSGEVTLQSLTAAYAAFANQGDVPQPLLILRVEDTTGHELYASQPSSTHAISPTTAYLMATMLADVINAGTGARARSLGFSLPAAGKTGTTNEYRDAWFVGFTPSLVAGVWVGFDQPQTILARGFAAEVAVPLWANFMKVATEGNKPEWLSPPAGGVTTAPICRLSGLLATDGCERVDVVNSNGTTERKSMVYIESFARGTAPIETCHLHPRRGTVGALASVFTLIDHPAPAHVDVAAATSSPASVAAAPPAPSDVPAANPETEAPKKKRGFLSKIFRVGR
jgi:penicillin-binding protein 1A